MTEMKGTCPQWAFIQAVQAQGDSDWAGQHFALMIGCEEDEKTPPTVEGLINRYRRWISTKRLHTKTIGSFATQGSTPPTLDIAEPEPILKPRSTNRTKCACGLNHAILKCYTLNPEAEGRPHGYKLNLKSKRNCLHAFKDPELLKKVKKLYQDNNIRWTFDIPKVTAEVEEASQTRPQSTGQGRRTNATQVDDAYLSVDNHAFAVCTA